MNQHIDQLECNIKFLKTKTKDLNLTIKEQEKMQQEAQQEQARLNRKL